jgi:YHS domain-containing protein
MVLFAVPLYSCTQKEIKINHVLTATPVNNLKVKVVNIVDPVCKMETANYLKFTSNYKGKTYGFCSLSCKTKFLKNPEKYLQ